MKRLIVIVGVFVFSCAEALTWDDVWLTKDQQAMRLLKQHKPEEAAKLFQSKPWQGVSHYRAKHYQVAVQDFSHSRDALSYYNMGNALAQLHQYQKSIEAYSKALSLKPDFREAKDNREIVKKIMEKQKAKKRSQEDKKDQHKQKSRADKNDSSDKGKHTKNQSDRKDHSSQAKTDKKPKEQKNHKSFAQKEGSQVHRTSQHAGEIKPSQQATQQWLNQIPDDPGGLLRQKFLRDHRRYKKTASRRVH